MLHQYSVFRAFLMISFMVSPMHIAHADILDWLNNNVVGTREDSEQQESKINNSAEFGTTRTAPVETVPTLKPVEESPAQSKDMVDTQDEPLYYRYTEEKHEPSRQTSYLVDSNPTQKRSRPDRVRWGREDPQYEYETISVEINSKTMKEDSAKLNSLLQEYTQEGWELELTRTAAAHYPANETIGSADAASTVDYRFRRLK